MDTKIGKGQPGGYDQPIPSFEEFKIDYGLKFAQDLDKNIASEGLNLDIKHLEVVYPMYYQVHSMIEDAKREELTADEFLKKCEWFKQVRSENRENLKNARERGDTEKVSKFQSIEEFYQILGNDIFAASLYLEDQEINAKKKP